MNKKPRILLGDDFADSWSDKETSPILGEYGSIADFDFESDPDRFIERARTGQYDALMIDLMWCPEDHHREYKTGYRVLEAVREYAPIRMLHTSENDEKRERGYQYGATNCVSKGISRQTLKEILEK